MSNKKIVKDLTVGKVSPVLLQFAYPVMMSNLLQTAYNMIDMVVIGQFAGDVGLSAVSVGGDLMHFYTFIGMGFATAGQIMVSQYLGAGKKNELNEVIGTLFTFVGLVGVILSGISIVNASTFLNWLHVPALAYQGAFDYTICCSIGLVFIFGYNMVSAILRGMGDSTHPMKYIGLAAIMNTILDIVFIAIFKIGALGAALATVLSQGLSFILCVVYLYKNKEEFGFDFRLSSFRISHKPAATIVSLGLPIALQSTAGSISALFVGSFVNQYGVAASAITGVGSKLNNIALIVCNALNTSGATVIGQSFGAGKIKRVKEVVYRVFVYDFIFVSIISGIIYFFPEQIFGIFNDSKEVLALARIYAPVSVISFMGYSFRSPSLAFINGLGQAKINFLMGFVEGLILRIGLTYLFGVIMNYGVQGFWYGSAIASYGYALVVFPYFFSKVWEKRKAVV